MKKIELALICFFSLLSIATFSQQKTALKNVAVFGPISINNPIITNKNVNEKDALTPHPLSYRVVFPDHEAFQQKITSDTLGVFTLPSPKKKDALYLISFFLYSSSYANGEITVTTPLPFQIFLDGKKVDEKLTEETNPKNLRYKTTRFNMNVGSMRVVMKLLVPSTQKSNAAFRVSLSCPDSIQHITPSSTSLQRRIQIDDMLEGKRISSSSISPSGRFTLIQLRETLPEGKVLHHTEVYDNKDNRLILSEPTSRARLQWMSKSDLLSYIAENESGVSLFTIDPLTANQKVISRNLPARSFMISSDERSLYYIQKEKVNIPNPFGLKRMLSPDDRQSGYRNRFHIFRYDLETGLSQQITSGNTSGQLHSISNDSRHLLFSTVTETFTEPPFYKKSMFCLDLESMKVDTLWMNEKFTENAIFSPDGSKLLIKGSPEAFNGIGLNMSSGRISNSYDKQAYIMTLKTKEIEPITKFFDPAVESIMWATADNNIYLNTKDKDSQNIYCYNEQQHTFEKLPLKEEYIKTFDISKNGLNVAYIGTSVSNSSRTYLFNIKSKKSRLISNPYSDRMNDIKLGDVRNWCFTNNDNKTIEGRYYLPPDFDPQKKYPLIVYYYGGASPSPRTFESAYPLHIYAARDYVVYVLQPSGTVGFGQEFSSKTSKTWAKHIIDDIILGTQLFAQEHAFVDDKKIGCIGASYGGFITQLMQTKTNIFATAVSHAGISNISDYWGEGHWGYTYSERVSPESYPWNNRKLFVEESPIFNADKINTPLLLLHGTADTNVPPGESMQMYLALKLLGKPVEFIQVEQENHVISDYKKRISWNHAIYAWFDKWLKNNSVWWSRMFPEK